MIIRTSKKQQRYSVIDNTGFEDPRLSYKAKGLLGYFLTKPDNWQVRMEDLDKHGTDGIDSIKSGMRELRKIGYATLETGRDKNGHLTGKEWVIHETPIVGKSTYRRATERGISRRSGNSDNRENPIDGKSPYIVSTEDVASTEELVNTDFLRTSSDEKNSDSDSQKKAPPVPAAPPTMFSESAWYSAPGDKSRSAKVEQFAARVVQQCPDADGADFLYYYQRCEQWSQNRGAKSRDWPATAAKFILEDRQRGQNPSANSQPSQPLPNHGKSPATARTSVLDRETILDRASRVLAKLGE